MRQLFRTAPLALWSGLLVASLLPLVAHAQGLQRGDLTGTVTDADGDRLPGVAVAATSPALQGRRSASTGANGDYLIKGLLPGVYTVLFEMPGMRSVERSAVVELGRTARVDASLELTAFDDTVVVHGVSPTALDHSQVGENYTETTVDSLPIGRTPMEIARFAPGVTANVPDAGQVRISGAYAYDNVFLLDGADINDAIFGAPPVEAETLDQGLFIEDAIEETQVLTAAISAEYGRFSGGVVNLVTKSGGDDLRGSFRIDLSNPSWRDETPLEEARGQNRASDPKPVWTATLGGPVLEDRLWYFLAGRAKDSSDPGILPVTNQPHPNDFNDQRWQAKLTWSPNDRHSLQATRLDTDTSTEKPSFLGLSIDPPTINTARFLADLFVVRYGGILSPALFFEAQYSEKNHSFRQGGTSPDLRDSPFFTLTQSPAHYNAPQMAVNDPIEQGNEQWTANLSYFFSSEVAGSHDLKLGAERLTVYHRWGGSQSATGVVFVADYLAGEDGTATLDEEGRLQPVFTPGSAFAQQVPGQPGSRGEIETTSLYLNDRWNLGRRWSFNLGLRYETISGDGDPGVEIVDADALVPRLAVTWDPRGDGRYQFGASYSEYSGTYNPAQFLWITDVGPTRFTQSVYLGPPGVGIGFSPGFELENYLPFFGRFPNRTVFQDAELSSARSEELTVSGGVRLPRGGYVEATYIKRTLGDIIEDFITIDNGTTTVELPNGAVRLDNIVFRNTDLASRDYGALQVQGRYQPNHEWTVNGNWTYQLENDGNFEGERPDFPTVWSILGDYPEIVVPERSAPSGRLAGFQRHKVRLWSNYSLSIGETGALDLGLLYRYDSPRTFSLVAENAAVSGVQLARDPGYAQPPFLQPVFFGSRGSQEFDASHVFDLSVLYSISVWGSLEPWIKLEVRNLFNDQSKIAWDTTVLPSYGGPVDEHGIPTQYLESPTFGQARSPEDFVTPREFFVSLGLRF